MFTNNEDAKSFRGLLVLNNRPYILLPAIFLPVLRLGYRFNPRLEYSDEAVGHGRRASVKCNLYGVSPR